MNEHKHEAAGCCHAGNAPAPEASTTHDDGHVAANAAPAHESQGHACCHAAATEAAPMGVRSTPGREGAGLYVCPMCPGVESPVPASCPKCGMALEAAMPVASEGPDPELVDMRRRFWIALALTLPLVVFEMAGMAGLSPGGLAGHGAAWVQFALATPVVLWCGWPLLVRGWRSIANRSLNRAQDLALEFKASAISLDALDEHLAAADIVISSTASPTPVVTLAATRAAITARRRRPMFMLDIAVPRDIEPAIADLEDVYLYTIDDLRQVVDDNLKARQDEAQEARQLIEGEVARFMSALRTLDAAPIIRDLRARADQTKAQTLEQARRMIASGKGDEALEFLANTLTNRLLHAPSRALRLAAEQGDAELIDAAHRLYDLEDGEH